MNISKVDSWIIAELAFDFVKFASLIESPDWAHVNLDASAPYYLIASIKLIKFPADFDIF